MTPVETLEAAIKRLEFLSDGTGEWKASAGVVLHGDTDIASCTWLRDAELIVTMHAAIPAVLAILRRTRDALVDACCERHEPSGTVIAAEMGLARAILEEAAS